MSYRVDLRTRVVNWVWGGNRRISASKVFEVHYNTVKAWVAKSKETGECRSKAHVPSKRRKLDRDALRQEVQDAPDSFQSERAGRFAVVPSTISKAFAKMGVTRKKKRPITWNKMRNKSRLSSKPGRVWRKNPWFTWMNVVSLKIFTEKTVGHRGVKKCLVLARANERRNSIWLRPTVNLSWKPRFSMKEWWIPHDLIPIWPNLSYPCSNLDKPSSWTMLPFINLPKPDGWLKVTGANGGFYPPTHPN